MLSFMIILKYQQKTLFYHIIIVINTIRVNKDGCDFFGLPCSRALNRATAPYIRIELYLQLRSVARCYWLNFCDCLPQQFWLASSRHL